MRLDLTAEPTLEEKTIPDGNRLAGWAALVGGLAVSAPVRRPSCVSEYGGGARAVPVVRYAGVHVSGLRHRHGCAAGCAGGLLPGAGLGRELDQGSQQRRRAGGAPVEALDDERQLVPLLSKTSFCDWRLGQGRALARGTRNTLWPSRGVATSQARGADLRQKLPR